MNDKRAISRTRAIATLRTWGFIVLAGAAFFSASAEAREPWPDHADVLSPDPVTGKEKFWEYWVYDRTFAERFKNFDPANSSADLTPGVHAIAFRTFKMKTFDFLPEHFQCEYEIYFDDRLRVPTGDVAASPLRYPNGATPGFQRLQPTREEDASWLSQAVPDKWRAKSNPLIVGDGQLDGRYGTFFLSVYFPKLVSAMSVAIVGRGGTSCAVLAPKRPDSRYWILLLGELPFDLGGKPHPYNYSDQFKKWLWSGTFNAGRDDHALAKGFVRVPEALYRAVLPRVALIKSVNECVTWRARYVRAPRKDPLERFKTAIFAACDDVETKGEIYDLSMTGRVVHGRQDPRF